MRVLDEAKVEAMAAFIKEYTHANNGVAPSLAEIMAEMSLSKATAYRYMVVLRDRGIVDYSGKGTMRVAGESRSYCGSSGFRRVPIYGSVVCGTPEEEEQNNEGYLAIPEEWASGECFLLRAKGESMTGVGVDPGDLVLVRRVSGGVGSCEGKVVVALTEDGNTLKRLFWKNGRPRLHPENERYEDIYPEQMTLQGVALRVIKEIR